MPGIRRSPVHRSTAYELAALHFRRLAVDMHTNYVVDRVASSLTFDLLRDGTDVDAVTMAKDLIGQYASEMVGYSNNNK